MLVNILSYSVGSFCLLSSRAVDGVKGSFGEGPLFQCLWAGAARPNYGRKQASVLHQKFVALERKVIFAGSHARIIPHLASHTPREPMSPTSGSFGSTKHAVDWLRDNVLNAGTLSIQESQFDKDSWLFEL